VRGWLEAVFAGFAVALCFSYVIVVARQLAPAIRRIDRVAPAMAFCPALALSSSRPLAAVVLATGFGAVYVLRWRARFLHPAGATTLVGNIFLAGLSLAWLVCVGFDSSLSAVTRTIIFLSAAVFALVGPVILVGSFFTLETLFRDSWTPAPVTGAVYRSGPRVSIHLPCYAEPPDIVLATLNTLAQLEYDNFEVLVIDNNTKDPDLWRPVAEHCRALGEVFRFYHVEHFPGAKAGALNLALALTCPRAELIAVVDADYQVTSRFLADLVGHFRDPLVGFVQTLYDYRDWAHSRYLGGCFWDYRFAFRTLFRSLHERAADFPLGTMFLMRRRALEEVGGWAPWALTEDFELGPRLRIAGYMSVLLQETYGFGLIPGGFDGYTKQRFRWTYGPVQALKRSWRLLAPGMRSRSSALSTAQRLLYLYVPLRHLANTMTVFCAIPLTAAALLSTAVHHETLPISGNTVLTAAIGIACPRILSWLVYWQCTSARWLDIFAGLTAGMAQSYTRAVAAGAALVTRNTAWRRTNKFPGQPSGWKALTTARSELVFACTILALVAGGFAADHTAALAVLQLVLLWQAGPLLAAPAAALLADYELRYGLPAPHQ
jgi:cellulose synthase/poly-beta-1,6-N-acetylglucosamine synthase-like glycosyltransferase